MVARNFFNSKTSPSPPATIAVIGGGPGAMFFCHALEVQKKELESKGEDVSKFPIVRCFERSAGPGGVWRSDRTHGDESNERGVINRPPSPLTVITTEASFEEAFEEEKKDGEDPWIGFQKTKQRKVQSELHTPNMYSGLWTNGAKELFEMYDYTFRDHFGDVRMPTHLPRKHVLEYFLARVTRNCPDFFEHYFSFETTVTNVSYGENKTNDMGVEGKNGTNNNKFRVCTRDETTGTEQVRFFDKCIWAGGRNGIPRMPRETCSMFEKGGFPGKLVHSSDTSTFKSDVDGKTVLIVGGGLSAEDLALMAIKEGVKKVYCTTRWFGNEMNHVSRWPYDKVEVFSDTKIDHVQGREVTLSGVYYDGKRGDYVSDPEVEKIVLRDIDTVIFATGYGPNLSMLDQALLDLLPKPYESITAPIPSDWSMRENDFTREILGDKNIRPEELVTTSSYPFSENTYRGVFSIDNPNMIFLTEFGGVPLVSLEVFSWMIARIVTEQMTLPSIEEIKADERRILLECLNCPSLRYEMDWKFQKAIDDIVDEDKDLYDNFNELYSYATGHAESLEFKILGELMNKFAYPVSYLCPDGKTFSKYHEAMVVAGEGDWRDLSHVTYDTTKEEDGWRSFRENPHIEMIKSFFTGIRAKLLPKPWMDLDGSEKLW